MIVLLSIKLAFLVLCTIWISRACWRTAVTAIRTGTVQSIGSRIQNKRQHSPVKFWALTACYFAAVPFVMYAFALNTTRLCQDLFSELAIELTASAIPEEGALVIRWRILIGLALANLPVYVLIGRLVFFHDVKDVLRVVRLSVEPEELSAAKGADRFLGNKLSDFVVYGFLFACIGLVWCEYVVITEFILK